MAKEPEKARENPKGRPLRKPYVKPGFRYERVFETMALTCGKTGGTEGQCHMVLKRS
ncbi:MAG: hypothetical protein ACREQC_07765 [Candidatus Binataceae bacterium]